MSYIDMKVFNELKEMSGGDFINELIDAFLEDAPTMITNMHSALQSGNVELFRRNAHSIKSNANIFGAQGLAAQAKELEALGREGNLNVGNRLEELEATYTAVAGALRELRV